MSISLYFSEEEGVEVEKLNPGDICRLRCGALCLILAPFEEQKFTDSSTPLVNIETGELYYLFNRGKVKPINADIYMSDTQSYLTKWSEV